MPGTSSSDPWPQAAISPGRIVVLAIAVIMVDGFDLQAIGFLAPEIAASWSVDIAAFGPVFSAALAGSMLGAIVAGPAARRFGRRDVLAGSLALFGLFTLALAWARDLHTLIVLRFVVGIGLGAAIPLVASIVADCSPSRWRATLVVLALCGQPIGAILGSALCARFIPIYGWPFAFYLGGVLPLLLCVAVLRLQRGVAPLDRSPAAESPGSDGARLQDLFGPGLLPTTTLLWTSAFLITFCLYVIVSWLPSSVRAAGHSLDMSVLALGLFNFGGIAGALIVGTLMDRLGPLKVMPAAFGVAGISLALLDGARAVPELLLAASFASGLAGYGAAISFGSLIVMLYPAELRTTGLGCALAVGRLGAAVGPLVAGFALAAGLEIGRLTYLAAGAAVLVMISLRLLGRLTR